MSAPTRGINDENIMDRMMGGTAIAAQYHQNSDRVARSLKLVRLSNPDLTASRSSIKSAPFGPTPEGASGQGSWMFTGLP